MKLISIVIVFLVLSLSAYSQLTQEIAAVLPIKCSGFDNENLSEIITELTQDAFIKYSNYKIVEKSQVNKILNEQGFQISGLTENAVEAGKLLATNKVVVGSLVKLGTELTLSLRLVDTQSGEVLKSEKKSARIEIEDINNVLIDPTVQILVSEKPGSIITILLKSITGLPNMDMLSPSDPWLQVYVGNRLIGRTDFIKDNNSPQFNKRFEITDYSNEIIRIKVFDHDVTQDKSIGEVVLKETKSGLYPILFESPEGSVENRGQLEVVFEK
ncbi:MAG: hypothetical protein HXY50_17000 [Ignavibacteriaceae bacterium]|nr:hypothetical protein [Ignavibacteriaceae bacterium]